MNDLELFGNSKAIEEMSHQEKINTLARFSAYMSADSFDPAEFGKEPMVVTGVLLHPVSIRQEKQKIDRETGDIVVEEFYVDQTRTVFRLIDGRYIGFVSVAAEQFVRNFLVPMFGLGDWTEPVKIQVKQLSKGNGRRTYNFVVVNE